MILLHLRWIRYHGGCVNMIESINRPMITLIDMLMFVLFSAFIVLYCRAVVLWLISGGHYWALEYLTINLVR